jgi:hypothetical protein
MREIDKYYARNNSGNQPQVIKVQKSEKEKHSSEDWKKCKISAAKLENLAREMEKDLNGLAEKYAALNTLLVEAYKEAPLTDCGFGVSPLGPGRVLHALKCHLIKRKMHVDNGYFGDTTKFPEFNEYILEATKWLLKFS